VTHRATFRAQLSQERRIRLGIDQQLLHVVGNDGTLLLLQRLAAALETQADARNVLEGVRRILLCECAVVAVQEPGKVQVADFVALGVKCCRDWQGVRFDCEPKEERTQLQLRGLRLFRHAQQAIVGQGDRKVNRVRPVRLAEVQESNGLAPGQLRNI
jgi:hypothetical protein